MKLNNINLKIIWLIVLLGMSFLLGKDEQECESYDYEECILLTDCEWSDEDESCIELEDNEDNEDNEDDEGENYLFRAHAEFEVEEEYNNEIHFGKVKTKIDSQDINSIEFDIKNLMPNNNYYLEFNNVLVYDFIADNSGLFEWIIMTDGIGDTNLPSEYFPVSNLSFVGLYSENGLLIAQSLFELDDDGCDDLSQLVCNAIPLCTWDDDGECEENEWELSDENEEWDVGEYFSEEFLDLYIEYMNYYNSSGDGLFNFITIDATNNGTRADIGDEIGLLDYQGIINGDTCDEIFGETVTASGVWDGSPLTLFAYGNLNVCEENGLLLPGFISGNPIVMRVWKPDLGVYFDIDLGILWGENQMVSTIQVNIPSLDVNDDGSLDVIDVINMVQIALGNTPFDINADITNDNTVDIVDIIQVIDIILNQ